jgi:hypothetical protein
MRDTEAAADLPAGISVRARSLIWTLVIGALLGSWCGLALAPPAGARFEARLPWPGASPGPRDWPHAARAGESARLTGAPDGPELVVTAGSAGSARALARAFVAVNTPGTPEFNARIEATRAAWCDAVGSDPLPAHTRAAEVAARLLARARWGRSLAHVFPVAGPEVEVPEPVAPAALLDAWQEVQGAIRATDPAAVEAALARSGELESRWFSDDRAWSGWLPAARAEAWRRWQLARAVELEDAAARGFARQSPFQRRLARQLAREYLVAFDEGASAPWLAFAPPDPRAVRPLVRPILSAWWPPLAAGGGVGVLLAVLALWLGARLQPALPQVRLLPHATVSADPSAPGPRLHVVSGGTPSAVMRAALELAARRVALGERVLLVDASASLRLHERLDRDARWGLLECLAADMPMLGLVQYAGHPGLYLLPHGNADRLVGWSSLGRKLDEVVPHFGRIVLALEPHAPAGIGDAVRGRAVEGWWAGADPRAARAADLATGRFGIVFHGLDLSDFPEASLEVLAARVLALRPPGPPPEAAPITARALPRMPPAPTAAPEPIVLDCDLQVRQRLRSLAWLRRLRADNRRAEAQVHP